LPKNVLDPVKRDFGNSLIRAEMHTIFPLFPR
jgi:hypothetical protein